MENLEKISELFLTVRESMDELQDHKLCLEAALGNRGFADVVQVIRSDIAKRYMKVEENGLQDVDDCSPTAANLLFSNKHALLLEDIVRTLSRYLNYETLQEIRMVHPTWNNSIVTQRYLQKTKLVIHLRSWDFWEFKSLIDAFPIEKNDEVKVPTTVCLPNLGFVTDPEPLTTWFKIYGPRFTRIEIGEDEDDLEGQVDNSRLKSKTFIRWLTEMLPNLKELQINNFDFRGRLFRSDVPYLENLKLLEIGSGNKDSLGDALSVQQFVQCTSKNLETLRLWLRPKQQFQYLKSCHHEGHLMNLTALDLSEFKLTYPTLQLLTLVDFKHLKRLVFRLETSTRDKEVLVCSAFASLLDNVKKTLEELTGGLARDLFRFPEMNELRKLESYICDSAHARSIELLTLSPKLDTLTLVAAKDMDIGVDHCLIFGKLFPPGLRFQNNSLKKLDLSNFPFDQEACGRLVTSLPALEILSIGCIKMHIVGEMVWSLTKFFKDLENLKKLLDLKMSFQRTFGWGFDRAAEEFNGGISIGFSKLISLKQCSLDFGRSFPVSKQAFTDGFMKSPSLQRLTLRKFVIGPEIRPRVDALRNKNVEVELLEWFSSSQDTWPVIYSKYK